MRLSQLLSVPSGEGFLEGIENCMAKHWRIMNSIILWQVFVDIGNQMIDFTDIQSDLNVYYELQRYLDVDRFHSMDGRKNHRSSSISNQLKYQKPPRWIEQLADRFHYWSSLWRNADSIHPFDNDSYRTSIRNWVELSIIQIYQNPNQMS